MDRQILVITSLVMLAALTGCAPSPYELVEQGHDWQAAWEPVLEDDARQFAETVLVKLINDTLATYYGVTHVETYEFERIVYFEPKPDPNAWPQADSMYFRGGPRRVAEDIPEGVIASEEWVDRYALAQELSARCVVALAELKEIDIHSPTPFKVEVTVKITGRKRHAVASRTQRRPGPPDGYQYWTEGPMVGSHGLSWSYLLVPDELPGRPHEPGAGNLADEAAEKLGGTSPTAVALTFIYTVCYDLETEKWKPVMPSKPEEHRADFESLFWGSGISDEDRRVIYAPR